MHPFRFNYPLRPSTGDIVHLALTGEFDVIIHGVNCMGVMGAGVARAIRDAFPEAYEAYTRHCNPPNLTLLQHQPRRNHLGGILPVTVQVAGRPITIINAFTQYDYQRRNSPTAVQVDYRAVDSCFRYVDDYLALHYGRPSPHSPLPRIAYPQIGAGLANGDWSIVHETILQRLHGWNHRVVYYSPLHAQHSPASDSPSTPVIFIGGPKNGQRAHLPGHKPGEVRRHVRFPATTRVDTCMVSEFDVSWNSHPYTVHEYAATNRKLATGETVYEYTGDR